MARSTITAKAGGTIPAQIGKTKGATIGIRLDWLLNLDLRQGLSESELSEFRPHLVRHWPPTCANQSRRLASGASLKGGASELPP